MTAPTASRWFRWSLVIGLTLLVAGLWLPRAEHPLLCQAQDAYRQGDFLRAAQLYTQALGQCSDAGHVLFNRAAALCQAKAEDQAACDFQQVQASGPLHRRMRASYDRGNCLLRLACTRPGDRTAWLQQAIQAYETALELGRDTDSPVCHDARHNLALARKLLHHEQQARAASDKRDQSDSRDQCGDRPESEPEAPADRLLADASQSPRSSPADKPSPHQQDPEGQPDGRPTDPRSGQPEETCSVCQGDCDKECSACKKCQGKQGSQAGTTGQGQQPTPGQGAGAGRQGGRQPIPAGGSGEKGQRGSTSGTDGRSQPKSSRGSPGGQPADTPGTPRPGSVATRPEPSAVGGLGTVQEHPRSAAQSGLRTQAFSSPAIADAPGSERSAGGNAPADPSSSPQGARSGSANNAPSLVVQPTTGDQAVVELFFSPDSSPLPERSRSTAAVPPGPRGSQPPPSDSPAAVQAQRQLRSVVQRIEQARRQRLKAADVWRDHPRAQPDFQDW